MTPTNLEERTLTVREIAQRAGVTQDTVRRWLQDGDLKGYRLSRKTGWRVSETDLLDFIRRRSQQAM